MRLQLGVGRRRRRGPRRRRGRHRDRRIRGVPVGRQRPRRRQAHPGAPEPGRHRPDLRRAGHGRPDGPQRDRCRGAAGRDDRHRRQRPGHGARRPGTPPPTTPSSSTPTPSRGHGSASGASSPTRSTASRSIRRCPRSWTTRSRRSRRRAPPSSTPPTSCSATGPIAEFPALLCEFKTDIATYLETYTGPGYPKTPPGPDRLQQRPPRARVRRADLRLEQRGVRPRPGDQRPRPGVRRLPGRSRRPARRRRSTTSWPANDLDAIVSATNGPAWVTDPVNGDGRLRHVHRLVRAARGRRATRRSPWRPASTGRCPIGVTFLGGRWSEGSCWRTPSTSSRRRTPGSAAVHPVDRRRDRGGQAEAQRGRAPARGPPLDRLPPR